MESGKLFTDNDGNLVTLKGHPEILTSVILKSIVLEESFVPKIVLYLQHISK
jgi:hypothetical protein